MMYQSDTIKSVDHGGVRTGGRIRLALFLALGTVLLSAGCTRQVDRFEAFDGFHFKARTAAVDKTVTRAEFTTTILGVSQSLAGARQAARFEATKYCIAQFGSSSVQWSVGPDTAPENLVIVNDTLTFTGRCDP